MLLVLLLSWFTLICVLADWVRDLLASPLHIRLRIALRIAMSGVCNEVDFRRRRIEDGDMYPIDLLWNFLRSFDKGQIVFTHGDYDWKVETHTAPKSVWLSEKCEGSMQVCQGQGNVFGVTLLPDGFIVHSRVRTDYTQVLWQVMY